MTRYSIELRTRTRKYVKRYGVLSFAREYRKQLLDTGLDAVKTASKKVVHRIKLDGLLFKEKITLKHLTIGSASNMRPSL